MTTCVDYFNENMTAIGLPTPSGVFSSLGALTSNIAVIEGAVTKFGANVTMYELFKAGLISEKLGALGALSASYYAGASLGSIAVAVGRCLAGGTSIYDLFAQNDMTPPPQVSNQVGGLKKLLTFLLEVQAILTQNQEIMDGPILTVSVNTFPNGALEPILGRAE
jgi:hypothetical protein